MECPLALVFEICALKFSEGEFLKAQSGQDLINPGDLVLSIYFHFCAYEKDG